MTTGVVGLVGPSGISSPTWRRAADSRGATGIMAFRATILTEGVE